MNMYIMTELQNYLMQSEEITAINRHIYNYGWDINTLHSVTDGTTCKSKLRENLNNTLKQPDMISTIIIYKHSIRYHQNIHLPR